MTTPPSLSSYSPKWGSTTKLVIGLSAVALFAALVIRFRNIVGPLILAFMLAYLLHPVATRMSEDSRIPWRTSVNLVYLTLIILLAGTVTLSGVAVVQQIQSLILFVQQFIADLPQLITNLSGQIYTIGPFELNFSELFSQLNIEDLTNQVLGFAQGMLGRITGFVGTFAGSALSTLGWILFILLISYFLLADAGRFPGGVVQVELPGYSEDIERVRLELRRIWNVFFRGQMIIISLVILTYWLMLTILGVRYSLAIALLAGIARLVPYVGPTVAWVTLALVTFFQDGNHFGLQPVAFTLLSVVSAFLLDQIFDNLVQPRILGSALGVHPAALLVAAIISANLIGFIGLILAAPVLATLQLIGRYVLRKMFDLDPWPETDRVVGPVDLPWARSMRRVRAWWRARGSTTRPQGD